jgi:hypothetical protein
MASDTEVTTSFRFPTPKLTSIIGKQGVPTRLLLLTIQSELNNNAMSVVSTLSVENGLLALTVPPAEYTEANNGVPFVYPVAPPPVPVYPDNPTQFQIAEIVRLHAVQSKAYSDWKNTDKALLCQLREAVPAVYLQELKHPRFAFARVTTLEALTHLHQQFATITGDDLLENRERMEAAWHPPTPIQALFTQLVEGQQFATENGEQIPDRAVARTGFKIIQNTGLFTQGCREWRMRPEEEKTFANFRTFFDRQEIERRMAVTAESAGFHGAANSATAPPPSLLSEVAQLMVSMNERMDARMDKMHEQFMAVVTAAKSTAAPTATKPPKQRGYCWTHGHTASLNHTSATCNNPGDGHQEEATAQNKMGGSTAQFRPRNNRNRNNAAPQPNA